MVSALITTQMPSEASMRYAAFLLAASGSGSPRTIGATTASRCERQPANQVSPFSNRFIAHPRSMG